MAQLGSIGIFFVAIISVLLVLLATSWPIFTGSLILDDWAHLYPLISLQGSTHPIQEWLAVMSSRYELHWRPIAMATFGLEAWWHGLEPAFSRVVNLLIHATTGLLLFLTARLWITRWYRSSFSERRVVLLAAIVAIVWLIHPFNLTSVAYLIQRMNALSALFTISAILVYSWERYRQSNRSGRWPRTIIAITFFGLLGILSKENAVLLPVYLLVIEGFVFRWEARHPRDSVVARGFVYVSLAIAFFLVFGYMLTDPERFFDYAIPFTIDERFLTEFRVLAWYLYMLLAPDIGQMSLFHDGFPVSTGLFSPWTTVLAIGFWSALVAIGWRLRKTYPWLAFGLFWFLGGHLLESTVLPLELVYEHRNYLPGFGVLLAAVMLGQQLLRNLNVKPALQMGIVAALIGVLALSTHVRAYRWSDDLQAQLAGLQQQTNSPRANIIAGDIYNRLAARNQTAAQQQKLIAQAEQHFARAAQLEPTSPNAFYAWLMMAYRYDLPNIDSLLNELEQRLRMGQLDENSLNGLHELTSCVIKKQCAIEHHTFQNLFLAALDNPDLSQNDNNENEQAGYLRNGIHPDLGAGGASRVRRDYARYLATEQKAYAKAVAQARLAVKLEPGNVNARIDLINYLLVAGQNAQARQQLDQLSRQDRWGHLSDTIERLRHMSLSSQPLQLAPTR